MKNTALTVAVAAASFLLTFAFASIADAGESWQPKPAELVVTTPAPQVNAITTQRDPDCRSVFSVIQSALRGKVCA